MSCLCGLCIDSAPPDSACTKCNGALHTHCIEYINDFLYGDDSGDAASRCLDCIGNSEMSVYESLLHRRLCGIISRTMSGEPDEGGSTDADPNNSGDPSRVLFQSDDPDDSGDDNDVEITMDTDSDSDSDSDSDCSSVDSDAYVDNLMSLRNITGVFMEEDAFSDTPVILENEFKNDHPLQRRMFENLRWLQKRLPSGSLMEPFLPHRFLRDWLDHINQNISFRVDKVEFLDFLKTMCTILIYGISVEEYYDEKLRSEYNNGNRSLSKSRLLTILRAHTSDDVATDLALVSALEHLFASTFRACVSENSVLVIDDDKLNHRGRKWARGFAMSYVGGTNPTPVDHMMISRYFQIIVGTRIQRKEEAVEATVKTLFNGLSLEDGTKRNLLVLMDRGYSIPSVLRYVTSDLGASFLATMRNGSHPFKFKPSDRLPGKWLNPMGTPMTRWARGSILAKNALAVAYSSGSGDKGCALLMTTEPTLLNPQMAMKNSKRKKPPPKRLSNSSVALMLDSCNILELTSGQGTEEWKLMRKFTVTGTDAYGLIRAQKSEWVGDDDGGQEVIDFVYCRSPVKLKSMYEEEEVMKLKGRDLNNLAAQVGHKFKATLVADKRAELWDVLKQQQPNGSIEVEDLKDDEEYGDSLMDNLVKSWNLRQLPYALREKMRSGNENEKIVRQKLQSYIESSLEYEFVDCVEFGLVVDKENPALGCSVDGLVVVRHKKTGEVEGWVLEVKTLLSSDSKAAEYDAETLLYLEQKYKSTLVELKSGENDVTKVIHSVAYRCQILHNCAVFGLSKCIFVRANIGCDWLYGVVVDFDDLPQVYKKKVVTTLTTHTPLLMDMDLDVDKVGGVGGMAQELQTIFISQRELLMRVIKTQQPLQPVHYHRPLMILVWNTYKWMIDQWSEHVNRLKMRDSKLAPMPRILIRMFTKYLYNIMQCSRVRAMKWDEETTVDDVQKIMSFFRSEYGGLKVFVRLFRDEWIDKHTFFTNARVRENDKNDESTAPIVLPLSQCAMREVINDLPPDARPSKRIKIREYFDAQPVDSPVTQLRMTTQVEHKRQKLLDKSAGCVLCSDTSKQRKISKHGCNVCGVILCKDYCFAAWHKEENLAEVHTYCRAKRFGGDQVKTRSDNPNPETPSSTKALAVSPLRRKRGQKRNAQEE